MGIEVRRGGNPLEDFLTRAGEIGMEEEMVREMVREIFHSFVKRGSDYLEDLWRIRAGVRLRIMAKS